MALVPMPFNIFVDIPRLLRREQSDDDDIDTDGAKLLSQRFQDEVMQVLAQWEAKKMQDRLTKTVTVDMMERLMTKSDVMLERIHHLYETMVDHMAGSGGGDG